MKSVQTPRPICRWVTGRWRWSYLSTHRAALTPNMLFCRQIKLRLHRMVRSGHLGRVVSTSFVGSGLAWRRVTDPSHAYMYDGRSGATTLTVPAAHALDALSFVLGETIRYTATFGLSSRYVE